MAKKRASPGIGRTGDNLPAHDDIRSALAIEMIFEEEAKKLRERHKRARKRIEGMGVRLDDTKFLKSLDGKTGSEVIEEFKRHWHLVGAIHQDKHEQLDIFAPKPSAPEVRAAHYTLGLLKGLKGEDCEIPPAVVGDDRQQFIDGHNEGMARRAAAWEQIGAADRGEAPIDGTGKTPSPKAVAAQAAKDFAQDHGDDPLTVGGVTYPNMRQANAARKRLELGPQPVAAQTAGEPGPAEQISGQTVDGETLAPIVDGQPPVDGEPMKNAPAIELPPPGDAPAEKGETDETAQQVEARKRLEESQRTAPRVPVMRPVFDEWDPDWTKWSGVQSMAFRRWFESLPEGVVPPITHEGAVGYYRALVEERQNRNAAGPSEEEAAWDQAAPAKQAAELPDPAEVEAAAKKLAESGFAPKKGRSRNLAKA